MVGGEGDQRKMIKLALPSQRILILLASKTKASQNKNMKASKTENNRFRNNLKDLKRSGEVR